MTDRLPPALFEPLTADPLVVVDVGARGGPAQHWRPLFEVLYWIGVEPDARSREALTANPAALPARHLIVPDALAAHSGVATLHLTRDEGDSSTLLPNRGLLDRFPAPERFDVVGTREMGTRRLDDVLAEHSVARVDILKIDTQGTEHGILQGAHTTLRTGLLGVEVEVEFAPLYQGQHLFADVDTLLRDAGLALVDLSLRRWPYAAGADLACARGPVVWGDALYLRPPAALASALEGCSDADRRATVTRAMLIALVHGLPDIAMEILHRCNAHLDADVHRTLELAARAWHDTATYPAVPLQVALKPVQMRALRALEASTGLKPTAQARRAIQRWIEEGGATAPRQSS